MADLDPISQGLGILTSGVQLYSSLHNEAKSERELKSIVNPFYKIQDEYYQNRNMAGQMAGEGMPAATKDYVTSESQRGLGAGVGGVLQSGGNVNDIEKMFDIYNKSIDRTAAQDAQQHVENIQNYWNANKDLAGQKTTQWALNEYQPTMEKKKQLSENISADKTNVNSAISGIVGSASALTTSMQNNDLTKELGQNNSLLEKLFK
jgi:hypothetical protein